MIRRNNRQGSVGYDACTVQSVTNCRICHESLDDRWVCLDIVTAADGFYIGPRVGCLAGRGPTGHEWYASRGPLREYPRRRRFLVAANQNGPRGDDSRRAEDRQGARQDRQPANSRRAEKGWPDPRVQFARLRHMEDHGVKPIAEKIALSTKSNVVVTAGAHWDNIDKDGIKKELENGYKIAELVASELSK